MNFTICFLCVRTHRKPHPRMQLYTAYLSPLSPSLCTYYVRTMAPNILLHCLGLNSLKYFYVEIHLNKYGATYGNDF